jgi:hypothetical protein
VVQTLKEWLLGPSFITVVPRRGPGRLLPVLQYLFSLRVQLTSAAAIIGARGG